MARKQLSIPEDDRDVLSWIEAKKRDGGYSEAIRELIRRDIAQARGERRESQALTAASVRQIVREEVARALEGVALRAGSAKDDGGQLDDETLEELAAMSF